MMKTLFVAVAVLSLTSVCQPAPLTCDKLLKPVDKSPDLAGRWYIIALSSDMCLIPALVNNLLWPSAKMDIAPMDTPKLYEANTTVKMYGYCETDTEPFLFENNTIFDVDSNNLPTGDPEELLQTSCPDCLVIKGNDLIIDTIQLLSRRKKVTADEMKEFEAQVDCLDWAKPQVLNSDHEYGNCKSLEDESDFDASKISDMIYKRLKNSNLVPISCIAKSIFQGPSYVSFVQEAWGNIWKSLED